MIKALEAQATRLDARVAVADDKFSDWDGLPMEEPPVGSANTGKTVNITVTLSSGRVLRIQLSPMNAKWSPTQVVQGFWGSHMGAYMQLMESTAEEAQAQDTFDSTLRTPRAQQRARAVTADGKSVGGVGRRRKA